MAITVTQLNTFVAVIGTGPVTEADDELVVTPGQRPTRSARKLGEFADYPRCPDSLTLLRLSELRQP